MRIELQRAIQLLGVLFALGCQADRLLEPVDSPPAHSGLEGIAVRVVVDVEQGMVRVLPAQNACPARTAHRVRDEAAREAHAPFDELRMDLRHEAP